VISRTCKKKKKVENNNYNMIWNKICYKSWKGVWLFEKDIYPTSINRIIFRVGSFVPSKMQNLR
jgi:hypothetical protein